MEGHKKMEVVQYEVGGWWLVLLNGVSFAMFKHRADANIYCQCCFDTGHADESILASGLKI